MNIHRLEDRVFPEWLIAMSRMVRTPVLGIMQQIMSELPSIQLQVSCLSLCSSNLGEWLISTSLSPAPCLSQRLRLTLPSAPLFH